jgi:hypothetical protein
MSRPADRLAALASHLLRDEHETSEITLEIDAGLSVMRAAGAIPSGICPRYVGVWASLAGCPSSPSLVLVARESLKGKTLVIT